jgi:hypothetical protein
MDEMQRYLRGVTPRKFNGSMYYPIGYFRIPDYGMDGDLYRQYLVEQKEQIAAMKKEYPDHTGSGNRNGCMGLSYCMPEKLNQR